VGAGGVVWKVFDAELQHADARAFASIESSPDIDFIVDIVFVDSMYEATELAAGVPADYVVHED
jgi:hypothetical protein